MLFRRFSAPKARVELKLDEVAYEYSDKLTGKIAVDAEEDIQADEIRLEFTGDEKKKFEEKSSGRSSSFVAKPSHIGFQFSGGTTYQRGGTSSSLEAKTVHIGGAVVIQKGQHYEIPFNTDIPLYTKADPFTEIKIKVKGVVAAKGRPDLTHEVEPVINFPYVVECLQRYGGCGFTTPQSTEPVQNCPKCGKNLEEVWSRKYSEEAARTHDRIQQGGYQLPHSRKRR